ncbi:hypothetical protein GCM10010129_78350 [Streptomyces fumigatiscleroticus]|nr:hypothetical protein GCM10010129_78350 [Streptomyces fumigatiscleroticus]
MQPDRNLLERTRAVYEEHVRTCRFCAGQGAVCQASRFLRRTYNNLLREDRHSSADAPEDRAKHRGEAGDHAKDSP